MKKKNLEPLTSGLNLFFKLRSYLGLVPGEITGESSEYSETVIQSKLYFEGLFMKMFNNCFFSLPDLICANLDFNYRFLNMLVDQQRSIRASQLRLHGNIITIYYEILLK